jgi:tripartite-type tricarboxylate transporter receptor subunit TctC
VLAILQEADVRRKLEDLSLQPVGGTPRQTAQFFQEETDVWSEVIKDANVQAQ